MHVGHDCFFDLDKGGIHEFEVNLLRKNENEQEMIILKIAETFLSFTKEKKS
jgi:hypothetical protein